MVNLKLQNYQLKIYLWGALSSLTYCCFFLVILYGWILNWQISFLYFNFIGLMQCSKTLSVISSTDWERTIQAMKLHQNFEFGPASQDPFSICQIQLALDTVYIHLHLQALTSCRQTCLEWFIHVSISDLYIPMISLHISLHQNRQTMEIYKYLTDIWV